MPLDPADFFTAQDLLRGAHRARIEGWTQTIELLLDLALLWAVAFGAPGRWLHQKVSRLPEQDGPLRRLFGEGWLHAALLLAAIGLLRQVLPLPLVLIRRGVALDLGLSHEPWLSWWGRWGLETLVLCAGLALLAPVLGAVRSRWPRRWWLSVGIAGAVALVGDAVLEPYWTRIDFAETSLPAGELRDRVEALAALHGGAGELTVIDASKYGTRANAFVTGFGPSRRIVLTDTLLAMGDDAALGAVAHELGHRRGERMPLRLLMAGCALILFLYGTERALRFAKTKGAPTEAHALAFLLVAVTCVNLVVLPVRAALGRAEEREADALELSVRTDLDAYVRDQVSLVRANVQNPAPGSLARLLSDHPTAMERIERAVRLKAARSPGVGEAW